MFEIYDLNMNKLSFPDGVVPLEIFVGSISKERITESVEGRSGVIDYGFNYKDRPVDLFFRIKAKDEIDFRLLRSEIYNFFDVGVYFYVAESAVPSRVLKVVVDDTYLPDRLTVEYADFDVTCRTLDSVFWESKYTTLELHDSGYAHSAEKYGLVDNIDDEKIKYRFTENNFTVYNAGNVTVEPESMLLHIFVTSATGDSITIKNNTTGESFTLNRKMNARHIQVNGMIVTDGTTQVFRDTNKRFISLAPGDNSITVTDATFNEIRFSFKYYYK